MWRYDDLLIITEVIKQGSFIQASKKLSIPSSTISRRVSELEATLGVRLLERNSRKFSLTEKGQHLFNQCNPELQKIKRVIEDIQSDNEKPVGKLKVTAPVTLGNELLNSWFCSFAKLHPEIKLEIVLSNHYEDILDDSFDLAIRVGPLKDSEFIAQFLFSSDAILCASKEYINKVSDDLHQLSDIENIDFLSYHSNKTTLSLQSDTHQKNVELTIKSQLSSSSTAILRTAAIDGLGLACLPAVSIKGDIASGKLIHLFKGTIGLPKTEVYAVYPSKTHLPQKMRLLLSFIKERAKLTHYSFQ